LTLASAPAHFVERQTPVQLVPDLRKDEDIGLISNGPRNQLLGPAHAVDLGGVDPRHARIDAGPNRADRALLSRDTRFLPDLPRAEPDH